MLHLKISYDLKNMQARNLKVYSYTPYAPSGKLYYATCGLTAHPRNKGLYISRGESTSGVTYPLAHKYYNAYRPRYSYTSCVPKPSV